MFEDKATKAVENKDRRCSYTGAGVRCNHSGSMSHSVRGEGPFFCKFHFLNSNPFSIHAQEEAFYSQRHPDHHHRGDWRDKLIEEKQEELGLTKADETDRELAERSRKLLKKMGGAGALVGKN